MKILVYGAGVLGSIHAARLHEAGHDVSLLARGERLAQLREHGLLLAEGDSPTVRRVAVPVIDRPDDRYDLIVVLIRTHQMDAVLESIAGVAGDVLFLLNWAAGPDPLVEALGTERVLLGFPAQGGVMDGEIVRYRPTSPLTRLVKMPIGEPGGRSTQRADRVIRMFRSAGFGARAEPRMDAWLTTHAAFEVPLGQAVHAAGGPGALADDPQAIRSMIGHIRQSLAAMPNRPVPRAFGALQSVPEGILVSVFRRFLRSTAAKPLETDTPAVAAELDRLAEQLHAIAGARGQRLS